MVFFITFHKVMNVRSFKWLEVSRRQTSGIITVNVHTLYGNSG